MCGDASKIHFTSRWINWHNLRADCMGWAKGSTLRIAAEVRMSAALCCRKTKKGQQEEVKH